MELYFDITAKTLAGLEEVLASEIEAIGGKNIQIKKRSVYFKGDQVVLYKANLHLRTALRILKPIKKFKVHNEKNLYNAVKKIDWTEYLDLDETFAIDSISNSKIFKHSKYAALKVKDAIADHFRERFGKRPSVDTEDPTLRINIHIDEAFCTLSLDSSGMSLHKRGYRLEKNAAPLNEVLAAGMILLSGWNGEKDFYDPMGGSGTIAIEAGLIANNIPPLFNRKNFGFKYWKDYDAKLWASIVNKAKENIIQSEINIYYSDIDSSSVEIAKENIKRAKLESSVNLMKCDFLKLNANSDSGIIIMNPPYGERIKSTDIIGFYRSIGDQLKKSFDGFDAWILSSNKDALKSIGLRTSRRMQLINGSLECKYHKYELYQGSKKRKYQD